MQFQVNLLLPLRGAGHTAHGQLLFPVLHTQPPHRVRLSPRQSSEIQEDYSNDIPSFMRMNQVPLTFPMDSQADLL